MMKIEAWSDRPDDEGLAITVEITERPGIDELWMGFREQHTRTAVEKLERRVQDAESIIWYSCEAGIGRMLTIWTNEIEDHMPLILKCTNQDLTVELDGDIVEPWAEYEDFEV